MMKPARPSVLARLWQDRSGTWIIEFAMLLPVLIFASFGGLEIANMVMVHMRVNQIAISLADNASRMKQETVSGAPKMREFDVNQAFTAAAHQSAELDIAKHGRMILSSLETTVSNGQWIHWQRCSGARTDFKSSYGKQDDGKTGTAFKGMGPTNRKVTSEANAAVMVVEVIYDYQPIILDRFFDDLTIHKYSAMYVRDDRDLASGVLNLSPTVTVSSC